MENPEWRIQNGESRMENPEWRIQNGESRMENPEWRIQKDLNDRISALAVQSNTVNTSHRSQMNPEKFLSAELPCRPCHSL